MPPNTCYICRTPIDKYKWCLKCIKKAARGAARYFATDRMLEITDRMLEITDGNIEDRQQYLKSQTNKWERKFKKRLATCQ